MKYVTFGSTGVQVSEMCLGTMMFGERCDEAESDRILSASLDAGVTFVDTAAAYGKGLTEEIVGRIIKGKRDRIFLGTKVPQKTDSEWIKSSTDESLKRLQVEYVDLQMIHWPRPNMDVTDMMAGLDAVVKAGKVRFVGCCNFPAWLYAHCNAIAARNNWAPLVCNQIPYNLLERGVEVEVLPQAVADKVAITVYRPLSMGVLAGKYRPGQPVPEDSRGSTDARPRGWLERYGDGIGKLLAFAADRGLHPAQVSVAWVKHSPGVTCPIVGASSLGQVQATVKAFDIDFSDDEYAQLSAMFDTAVKEESGGNFVGLRRSFDLLA